ncbi:MAG: hypothetical protein GX211_04145, partial [Clostridiaceae bacterium]|nr:hypothetical protein [Clostridiaceae bacterium]
MKMKRSIALILLAAVIMMFVCGCGTASKTNNGQPADQSTTSKPTEKIQLRFTYWGSTYEKDVIS